tara:strand:+ start:772 stop:2247 length:1476 start_codon:yes stop_codon:yes gene_type:complete
MALIIEQTYAYKTLAAGQQFPIVISEDGGLLTSESNVSVKALVMIFENSNQTNQIHNSEYKCVPNAAGVCIFDLGAVIENYVVPTYNGVLSSSPTGASTFQGTTYDSQAGYHAIHNIDEYCYNENTAAYCSISFTLEFLGGDPNSPNQVGENGMYTATPLYFIYNGVIYMTDVLSYKDLITPDYGYDLATQGYINNGTSSKFLTDMPTEIDARPVDYGTVAFFNGLDVDDYSFETFTSGAPSQSLNYIQYTWYNAGGLDGTVDIYNRQSSGGWNGASPDLNVVIEAKCRYLFAGVFPANVRAADSTFQTALTTDMEYYTFQAFSNTNVAKSSLYRVNIIHDCRYEPIRLAWLNKHGAWDYYTFNKKSVRTLNSNRTNYQKLDGTWNESNFNVNKNQGGIKSFKVKTKEAIRINTDFIKEETAGWLEQLMTTKEVFILKDYFTGGGLEVIRKFNEPAVIKTTSFIKKTVANDKLIQYTFEIEKAFEIKTQGA